MRSLKSPVPTFHRWFELMLLTAKRNCPAKGQWGPLIPATLPCQLPPIHFLYAAATYCRYRKVKCDRQQPCSNCLRVKLNCSYPAGRGRAAKKSTRTLDTRLVDRAPETGKHP
ncbi:fungal zn(2)-Cys(6) binuclear cluster domain-containing protein [Ditylenchus destructor]|nr:fungal zn(2)-Cys(6) binuclear cluster domain-containing protein [Ditylenchus destructor]